MPSHIIRTQSENPSFKVYSFYKKDRLVALMMEVQDLINAPYIIVFSFVPPVSSDTLELNINTLRHKGERTLPSYPQKKLMRPTSPTRQEV